MPRLDLHKVERHAIESSFERTFGLATGLQPDLLKKLPWISTVISCNKCASQLAVLLAGNFDHRADLDVIVPAYGQHRCDISTCIP